ncbi:MAG: hypothetical protein Q9184_007283, partial [Pyrenodesmia sp. 2 TL-2023]
MTTTPRLLQNRITHDLGLPFAGFDKDAPPYTRLVSNAAQGQRVLDDAPYDELE